jgi:serine/threonine-protein kinase
METYCPKCFQKFTGNEERCPDDGSYLVSHADKDLTGTVLDERYSVLDRIGRGGMGVVYKAEQTMLKRVVALKVLRREVVQDENAVKRFLTEAQAIAKLDSHYTVTVYDFGVTRDGQLYYTMELLKGQPLSTVIREQGPLELGRCVTMVSQVCDSLGEAHERGILHRDVKPDNLFVVDRRGEEELRVLDFGIAKLMGAAKGDTMTAAGMIVGTPQYLSPEQAMGNPLVAASDLYSLAVVLYEMIVGMPPFQGETPIKTLWAHIQDPYPESHVRNPSVVVPKTVEAFLRRALEKDPVQRFQSAHAFHQAFKKAVAERGSSKDTVTLQPLRPAEHTTGMRRTPWESLETINGPSKAPAALGDNKETASILTDSPRQAEPQPHPAELAFETDETAEAPPDVAEASVEAVPDWEDPERESTVDLSSWISSKKTKMLLAGVALVMILLVGAVWAFVGPSGEKEAEKGEPVAETVRSEMLDEASPPGRVEEPKQVDGASSLDRAEEPDVKAAVELRGADVRHPDDAVRLESPIEILTSPGTDTQRKEDVRAVPDLAQPADLQEAASPPEVSAVIPDAAAADVPAVQAKDVVETRPARTQRRQRPPTARKPTETKIQDKVEPKKEPSGDDEFKRLKLKESDDEFDRFKVR